MGVLDLENLGPLKPLVGIWEGETGDDKAPGDDRGTEINKYRERMVLEPFKPVENHEQLLCGLRYFTQAWRIGEPDPFHDEVGYWIWDAKAKQVMKCVVIPRECPSSRAEPPKPIPGASKSPPNWVRRPLASVPILF